MNLRNSSAGFGLIQIVLHWGMATLIAVLLPLGLWMTELDYYDTWYKKGPDLHRAIGVMVGLLLLLRIVSRWTQIQPDALGRAGWERTAARISHLVLYLLPLAMVISGYLISTADGRSVSVFGWFEVPAILHGLEGQEDIAGDIHFVLAMLLLGMVGLHVLAAMRHHLVLKDATLRRMLAPPSDPSR